MEASVHRLFRNYHKSFVWLCNLLMYMYLQHSSINQPPREKIKYGVTNSPSVYHKFLIIVITIDLEKYYQFKMLANIIREPT